MNKLLMIGVVALFAVHGAHAGEMVGFVTHKVVVDDQGQVKSIMPMKSEIVVPSDRGNMSAQLHNKAMEKALSSHMNNEETLFDFAGAFNKAVDKTVSVVSTDTFKGIAAGAAALGAAAVAGGVYLKGKKDEERNDDLFYSCVAKTSNAAQCASQYNIDLSK